MKLLAISIVLTIHVGGTWQLDVSPQIGVPAPLPAGWALTVPGLTIYNPTAQYVAPDPFPLPAGPSLWDHEEHHWRQQLALGPWFWAAYLLSAGSVFEPYAPLDGDAWRGWQGVWMPSQSQLDNFPLFRIGSAGFQVLPGY